MLNKIIPMMIFLFYSSTSIGQSFTLFLNNGEFFGPGNAIYNDTGIAGVNRFVDAEVRNVILTGPLTGFVPFFNNGEDEPNVIAEKLQVGGVIDGVASDGTLINENLDTALRLNFSDPESGESADVMVVARASDQTADGSEPILPDEKGNLTFNTSVLADPGHPDLISRFEVVFTTGASEVPVSLKTQMGIGGGEDNAGPLKSGRVIVGKIGDYDQNGFLDGMLVLANNAPLDLIVGRGNPIAQKRPWLSDIPISPDQAAFLTLSNLLNNYPLAFDKAIEQRDFVALQEHLHNLDHGVIAVIGNFRRILPLTAHEGKHTGKAASQEFIKIYNLLEKVRMDVVTESGRIDKKLIDGAYRGKRYFYHHHWVRWNIENIMRNLQQVASRMGSLKPGQM